MLSRVADSIYWTARYIERSENIARFIDVNLHMSLDAPTAFAGQWEPLVAITGDLKPFRERYGQATRESVIHFLTFDAANPNSILSCLRQARENSRSVREMISSEVWEQVNRFYLLVSEPAAVQRAMTNPYEFFTEVKLRSHLIDGVANNTMSHGDAWHFMRMGRALERADQTTRLLDVKYFFLLPSPDLVGSPVDEMQWAILLRSATALEMYRKKYGRITPNDVVEFLLLDTEFPRAVRACVARADDSLHAISGTPAGSYSNPAERRLGQVRSELAYAQAYDIIASGLHQFLDGFQTRLNAVGDAVAQTFFVLRPLETLGTQGGPVDILSGNQGRRGAGGHSGHTGDLGQ